MKLGRKLIFAGMIGCTQAAVISVNMDSAGGVAAMDPGVTAGVEAVANWNNITSGSQTGTTTGSSLIDDSGAATAASMTVFNGFWQDNTSAATGDSQMYSDYTNTTNSADGLITVSGLGTEFTTDGYNVIVYMNGTDGMGMNTAIEIAANIDGGADQWIRVLRRNPSFDGAWSSTPFATEAEAQSSGTESNYLVITGLNSAGFDLNILKDPSSNANWARAGFRGIQIVSVPEPSAILLGGLGILGLLRRRR